MNKLLKKRLLYIDYPINKLKRGGRLIPKAGLGDVFRKIINFVGNHAVPSREQTMFEVQNLQRIKKLKPRTLQDLQNDLKKLGYYTTIPDGKMGKGTKEAISLAESNGYKIDMNNYTIKKDKSKQQQVQLTFGDKVIGKIHSIFGEPKVDVEKENKRLRKKSTTYGSKEEYIEAKLKEIRDRAAVINISTATPTFPIGTFTPGHDFDYYGNTKSDTGNAKNMTEDLVKQLFTKYKKEAETYLNNHPDIPLESKNQINRNIGYYDRVIKDPKTVSRCGSGIGFGCVYSATQSYNQEGLSGNNVFTNNKLLADAIARGQNTSYLILPWNTELEVGDIILIGTTNSKVGPHHAAMVTGFNMFGQPLITQTNAGSAGIDDRDINSHNAYMRVVSRGNDDGDLDTPGIQPQGLQIIRFIGSNSDRAKWEKEYNQIYGGDRK